ncbi:uncharacterized protein BO66DRAFT_436269 [Aspergillus aculeatinus CBS 121060]|uniref:Uncharacterized protein n=1 Tax=Aspergillus aculeatinus CBS 121060 TaxID=1448322 RepID=A0ACD1HGN5_9EURO|nr:hypothetical protein BO66DRAFT_436269 [Aspergillus aculeatinus CBS 121060]RAH72603.1 hypothetical protein BO66DRAFT_436269 [Aspergillus aculeatinus CBS 121060]
MNSQFRIIEHTIPCSSIREYHHAAKTDKPLQLAIKQYTPLNNTSPSQDGISIIAGHANGIPRECYEPLWDEMMISFEGKIKAIWFADCSNQGASGVLNEDNLGDDRETHLHMHYSLNDGKGFADHGHYSELCSSVNNASSALYPLNAPRRPLLPDAVTLTTTKAQEAWKYLRLNATPQKDGDNKSGFLTRTERFLGPDLAISAKEGDNNNRSYVTVCPWSCIAFELLPYVRPPVFLIFGEKSHINTPARRQDKLDRVGTGLGGGGQVRAEVLFGTSHMAPLEKMHDTACLMSGWLDSQLKA